ncbi:MAG: (d)CMP kinase [Myxococcales bacterium]|nr:(d)CMP kinase [Myxococcales bacterium]
MSRKSPLVAIDGPAGAGKSTVSRALADRLGMLLLDTGALYRLVALAAHRTLGSWDEPERIGALARELVRSHALALGKPERAGETGRAWLAGEDVSLAIRTPEMSRGASRVSALPAVREALLDLQRELGAEGGLVVEGRDIGTVVFPDAEVKFFLTASLEERARRRAAELGARGVAASVDETLREVRERDRADSERDVAPLRQAADAVLVDTTGVALDEVVDRMERTARARGA